ncbi:hypothetical protein K435DRAFT_774904 [Dendrothele bispora CBS 962.96]|uniref:Nudix hydrolase domain-containing protein n=1 Tax=Dendrothele bispora (strain CBS 962.96) TaxID=1314807 RepID=A0A4S8MLL6_DENBC|nr:hypothetical protein K435DRAFT_774904 [Dendrothele bispora CBS 962.96]
MANSPNKSSSTSSDWNKLRFSSRPQPVQISEWSSPPVPHSGWAGCDLMLGAGMVIIQPSTGKVVVVEEMIEYIENEVTGKAKKIDKGKRKESGKTGDDTAGPAERKTMTFRRRCFLPRGRKDIGESVDQTALREAYEESGYEVDFLPLHVYNRQPAAPNDREAYSRPSTEAIYHTLCSWSPRFRNGQCVDNGGEYFVSWFIGQIPENPVHHKGVGMPDEQNYVSRLMPPEEALNALGDPMERRVLEYAWAAYLSHHRFLQFEMEQEEQRKLDQGKLEEAALLEGDKSGQVLEEKEDRAHKESGSTT